MIWGYVRSSVIPVKTRSGSTWGRYGLLHSLRIAGDIVYVFHETPINDDFYKNLGVIVTSDYSKAKQCDCLIIEGSETSCRELREWDGTTFRVFNTERAAVLKTLRSYRGKNVLLQVADPIAPPLFIGETSSYQYGDFPTLPYLKGKSFLALSESLKYNQVVDHIDTIRSPISTLVNSHVYFSWNAALASVYLSNYVPRNVKRFDQRFVDLGYYGISKNGRWSEGSEKYGTISNIYPKCKKLGIELRVFTREKDVDPSIGDIFEVNPVEKLHDIIASMKCSLVLTDSKMNQYSYITTRTAEAWFFGTPIAVSPEYEISTKIIEEELSTYPEPLRSMVSACTPYYILTGLCRNLDEFYDRILKLKDEKYFKQEQDFLLSFPAIQAEDIYRLMMLYSFVEDECNESRNLRFINLYNRIKKALMNRKELGKSVNPLVEQFYLGKFGKKYRNLL